MPTAVIAVAALGTVKCSGITRKALFTRVLVVTSLLGLALIVTSGLTPAPDAVPAPLAEVTAYGVLQGVGLPFFFAATQA